MFSNYKHDCGGLNISDRDFEGLCSCLRPKGQEGRMCVDFKLLVWWCPERCESWGKDISLAMSAHGGPKLVGVCGFRQRERWQGLESSVLRFEERERIFTLILYNLCI